MATLDIMLPAAATDELPEIRKIAPADLKDALAKGLADFWAMPTHIVFLGLIYPVVGVLLGRAAFGYDVIPLLYPLAAGFALIGPLAAIGLYELSRRREAGLDTSWRHVFDVFYSPSFKNIVAVGLGLLVLFAVWIGVAQSLYTAGFGYAEPKSWARFINDILTTSEGKALIITGNGIGFVFALIALCATVVTFPLLLDRNVGPVTAVSTSVRAVLANPLTMALWGLIVAVLLAIGFATFMLGLAIIVPVLGHATWHLYRKVVVPDNRPHPFYNRRRLGWHYGAQFPASLFTVYRDEDAKDK
jgi:uncharacterized membrane protein